MVVAISHVQLALHLGDQVRQAKLLLPAVQQHDVRTRLLWLEVRARAPSVRPVVLKLRQVIDGHALGLGLFDAKATPHGAGAEVRVSALLVARRLGEGGVERHDDPVEWRQDLVGWPQPELAALDDAALFGIDHLGH